MNFNTIKQELNKKIRKMSKEDFDKFVDELTRIFYKTHGITWRKNEQIL